MSVPKSRRGESPAEYINLAREIYVFTYNRVRILPKSYTFYFSLPLYNAAREAYRMIKTANLIYVDEKSPEEIRRRNIQRRKEYYETARGYYNSMLDVLDLAYMTVNHEKIPPEKDADYQAHARIYIRQGALSIWRKRESRPPGNVQGYPAHEEKATHFPALGGLRQNDGGGRGNVPRVMAGTHEKISLVPHGAERRAALS